MKYKRRPELVRFMTKLCTDPERDCVEDLFGNPVEMVRTRQDTPRMVSVAFKIQPDELKELQAIADLFGMSVSKYCRDAVREVVSGHRMLIK